MIKILKILMLQENNISFRPVPLEDLKVDLKTAVREATVVNYFSTPNDHCCSFSYRKDSEEDLRTVVIDPDAIPEDGDMVIILRDNTPILTEFSETDHTLADVLGSVTHITKPMKDWNPGPNSNIGNGQEFVQVTCPADLDQQK